MFAWAEPYHIHLDQSSVPLRYETDRHVPEPNSGEDGELPQPDYRPCLEDLELAPEVPSSRAAAKFSPWQAAPPNVRSLLWPKRSVKSEYPEPVDVTILAVQFYDHYKERYLKVKRVETWLYRRSAYWEHIVHCNRARYTSFDVQLEDLERGDRFETRITWQDGSHRTIEKTMGHRPQLSFYIDEPNYLEY